jgi:2-keto-4-pentenoate hydratase
VRQADAVASSVAALGEQLREGDRIITGSVVQAPVAPGSHVVATSASSAASG